MNPSRMILMMMYLMCVGIRDNYMICIRISDLKRKGAMVMFEVRSDIS